MNQLVGLVVWCILFFRWISYFMNKSLAWINNIQVAKSWSFSTQSHSKCISYLSGSEVYLQNISFTVTPKWDCFTTDFTVEQQQIIPEWKIRLFLLREKIRSLVK